ncbi:hypothetical protein QNI16_19180 [Cytophagaceae bacterium YF14B1]|uniref:DUF3408 domain-containing protein n=1 Tax=Xanthocytophaga flava TaxID=3048013 RepID=A0AAE3QPR0_9BACT|nr:hypothetical protein [Xanthocytophaga flavus]MDJ1482631.1 hypothetical protein [Xanthocytophaga flavus]
MNKKDLISESLKNTPLATKGKTLLELAEEEEKLNREALTGSSVATKPTDGEVQDSDGGGEKTIEDVSSVKNTGKNTASTISKNKPEAVKAKDAEVTTKAIPRKDTSVKDNVGKQAVERSNYTFYLSQDVMEHLQRMIYWEGLRQKKQGASYVVENLLIRFMSDKKDYPPIPDSGLELEF